MAVSKPLGIFSPHAGIPDWASFALLPSWSDLAWARAYAEGRLAAGRPFAWVLYAAPPLAEKPLAWVPALRRQIEASGVLPHIRAMCYREEWYAGLPSIAEIDARCRWVGEQHAVMKEYFPSVATVTINEFTCPATEFGPGYYSPEPAHTDIRGAYTYVPVGHTWASHLVEHKLRLACGYRVGAYQLPRKPVALIVQAFRSAGGMWGEWPSAETTRHALRWAADPAVLAVWPFDYASRSGGLLGLEAWPDRHLLAPLGVG